MAAPVGPVGILSLKRMFASGHLCGLVSGLGISTADAIYGFLAVFGLTAISDFLLVQQPWFRILGGFILLVLAIRTYLTSITVKPSRVAHTGSYAGAYFSAVILTLMNPMLILSFAAVFASLGLVGQQSSLVSSWAIVIGVFCGSAIWWIFLSGIVSALSMKFNETLLLKINHFSGFVIGGFGLAILGSALFVK